MSLEELLNNPGLTSGEFNPMQASLVLSLLVLGALRSSGSSVRPSPLCSRNIRISFPYLVHFDHQIFVHPVHQDFISISRDPDDMIHASVCTVGLFPDFHISILSYLPEDLGTHSIYGPTSAELRRCIKTAEQVKTKQEELTFTQI